MADEMSGPVANPLAPVTIPPFTQSGVLPPFVGGDPTQLAGVSPYETTLSATKLATDKAAALLVDVADAEEDHYERSIEALQPRIFQSVLSFLGVHHRAEASIRVVNSARDVVLDRGAVDRAYARLEETKVDEDQLVLEGQLIGIIPYGGRFEFQPASGELIRGRVAPTMSESFLQRLQDEQAIGKLFLTVIRHRSVRPYGVFSETHELLELKET